MKTRRTSKPATAQAVASSDLLAAIGIGFLRYGNHLDAMSRSVKPHLRESYEARAQSMWDIHGAIGEVLRHMEAANDRTHRREAAVGDDNQTRTVAAASRSVQ